MLLLRPIQCNEFRIAHKNMSVVAQRKCNGNKRSQPYKRCRSVVGKANYRLGAVLIFPLSTYVVLRATFISETPNVTAQGGYRHIR